MDIDIGHTLNLVIIEDAVLVLVDSRAQHPIAEILIGEVLLVNLHISLESLIEIGCFKN